MKQSKWMGVFAGVLGVSLGAVALASGAWAPEVPGSVAGAAAGSLRLEIDPGKQAEAYTGRVYIVVAQGQGEPRRRMNDWFRPPLIFSKDVTDLAPGAEVTLDDSWLSFPTAWSKVEPGEYTVQAVVRRSLDVPEAGAGPDDLISEPVKVTLPLNADGSAGLLKADRSPTARPLRESERVKLVEMVSPSLSKFHGREYTVRAGVLLPEHFVPDGSVKYPVVYSITGFGGDHRAVQGVGRLVPPEAAEHVIMVVPDPLCFRGHSVFADSENNGPWGEMLVHELAPEIEKRYHGAGAEQRYVTGVSSGGWSSLWLQVTYPEEFAGCWSHCPDPVDFRDFQRIDLYQSGANMYHDGKGQRRPLARQGEQVMLWYEDFCKREWVLGPGGQIHSFEAVFSPRLTDGTPALVFDRETGNVDPVVAKSWEKYDIRLVLERNWKTLGPRLAGKLHVYAGGVDTYYLDGAARLLKDSLAKLGSDAEVEIVDGMPHTLYPEGNAGMYRAVLEGRKK